MLKGGATSTHM